MSVLLNESALLFVELLSSTLLFGLLKVGSPNAGELLRSRDLTSVLVTWAKSIDYITY